MAFPGSFTMMSLLDIPGFHREGHAPSEYVNKNRAQPGFAVLLMDSPYVE